MKQAIPEAPKDSGPPSNNALLLSADRAQLRLEVAKQRMRLAKEELKRARKRFKEAKREVKRARKRVSAMKKASKRARKRQDREVLVARKPTAGKGKNGGKPVRSARRHG
jgi:chromosome segregation ATPase